MMQRFFEEANKIKEKHPRVHLLIILLLIGFAISIGMLIRDVPHISTGHSLSVFRDILAINLATAGLFISVLSYSAYRILSIRLEQKTKDFFLDKEGYLFGQSYSSISFTHFSHYETSNDSSHLELAITMAGKAFKRVRALNMGKVENVELYCDVVNNFGYYLAERGNTDDKLIALKYADTLEHNIATFPDRGGAFWQDTIGFIREKYNE